MDKALILVVLVYWLTSSAYVIHYLYKNGERAFGIVLAGLLLGPILAFIVRDNEKETEEKNIREHIENDTFHRFIIPPPPPMSQVRREERDEAIRAATERIGKTKEFKFFRG